MHPEDEPSKLTREERQELRKLWGREPHLSAKERARMVELEDKIEGRIARTAVEMALEQSKGLLPGGKQRPMPWDNQRPIDGMDDYGSVQG